MPEKRHCSQTDLVHSPRLDRKRPKLELSGNMHEEPDALSRQSTEPIQYPMGEREGQEGGRGWSEGSKMTGRVEEREKERKRSGKVGNTLPSVMGHLS